MKLLQIKASQNPDKVNLVIDNLFLPFPVEKIITFSLTKNQEISPEFFEQIKKESIKYVLYNYALRQIAMLPQVEGTLLPKLNLYQRRYLYKTKLEIDREVQSRIIEEIINKLNSQKLLNQDQFVTSLINRYKNRKSQREIIYRLQQAGVDHRQYDLASLGLESENSIIQKLILKKVKNLADLADFNTKNKVISYLVRKGFSLNSAKTVIDDLLTK